VTAIGLKWRVRKDGHVAYWHCSGHARRLGYPVATQRLWAGERREDADHAELARVCHRLHGEMLDWLKSPANHAVRRKPVKNTRRVPLPDHYRTPGVVYFARSADQIKIGFTINLKERLAKLQTGTPGSLELLAAVPGTRGLERHLHHKFGGSRVRGEWFAVTDAILAFVRDHSANGAEERVQDRILADPKT
jgi:hypothetical protein